MFVIEFVFFYRRFLSPQPFVPFFVGPIIFIIRILFHSGAAASHLPLNFGAKRFSFHAYMRYDWWSFNKSLLYGNIAVPCFVPMHVCCNDVPNGSPSQIRLPNRPIWFSGQILVANVRSFYFTSPFFYVSNRLHDKCTERILKPKTWIKMLPHRTFLQYFNILSGNAFEVWQIIWIFGRWMRSCAGYLHDVPQPFRQDKLTIYQRIKTLIEWSTTAAPLICAK